MVKKPSTLLIGSVMEAVACQQIQVHSTHAPVADRNAITVEFKNETFFKKRLVYTFTYLYIYIYMYIWQTFHAKQFKLLWNIFLAKVNETSRYFAINVSRRYRISILNTSMKTISETGRRFTKISFVVILTRLFPKITFNHNSNRVVKERLFVLKDKKYSCR